MTTTLLTTALGRFRLVAFLEGLSFLVLLGIAMPLKYFADMPLAVRITGMAHGVLFIAYLFSIGELLVAGKWDLKRSVIAFLLALVPFGTFVLEAQIRKELASPAPVPVRTDGA